MSTIILFCDREYIHQEFMKAVNESPFLVADTTDSVEDTACQLDRFAPNFLIIHLENRRKDFGEILYRFSIISPRTRILVLQEECSSRDIITIIKAGAEIILPERINPKTLSEVLASLLSDNIHLPDFVASSLLEISSHQREGPTINPFILTNKERAILQCYADGMDHDEIEQTLGIPPEKIKAFTRNILQKIHFVDVADRYYNEVISHLDSHPAIP